MALRNAFEGIATEGTLRRLLEHVRFSKDSSDRLRVAVDTGSVTATVNMNNSTTSIAAGVSPSPYASTTWNIMDARADFQEASLQSFQITRNRWTIT